MTLIKLGICAMDAKSRSKPMRNILSRLLATHKYDCIIFGDKVIIDEDIENWPTCDFLISFHSTGFPLDKAIRYVQLRKPVCINDLPMQHVFWDRRIVLAILDKIGVPTAPRIEVDRDGGPKIHKSLSDDIFRELGIRVDTPRPPVDFNIEGDEASITVGNRTLHKSYVEKPVSGEDHRINIYFSKAKGGGGRRLFRKVGNKSSEHDPDMNTPRTDASYVYEQFMDVENAEDIKVYTLGPDFVHAETRKSPVVDGIVRRNTEGKEIRFITQLSAEEKEIARKISKNFKQNICGFDLLRAGGKSYVIDVNGWSFVKGNDFYYDKCAEILDKFCSAKQRTLPRTPKSSEKSWTFKSTVCVFRHADRTPKMKLKFNIKGSAPWGKPFIDLLQGRTDEIILREEEQLRYISNAAEKALTIGGVEPKLMHDLQCILNDKIGMPGTKAQLKPKCDEHGICEKLNVIVKWGGEFTHSGRYQSRDLGENMRNDIKIMNKSCLQNAQIYTSSERRAIATAEIFGSALLADTPPESNSHKMIIRKDLLDDSNAAKEPMDQVKKRLKTMLRPGEYRRPEFALAWRVPDVEPMQIVKETMEIMRGLREVMHRNWELLDVEKIQNRWCCGEWPELFKERWEKLFQDFCDVEPEKFDPSRISELYDSIKYDALHNRVFLEAIFTPPIEDDCSQGHEKCDDPYDKQSPGALKDLYAHAKNLFDFIAPQEYGIEKQEKLEIGVLTSLPLLHQIIGDLKNATETQHGTASYYFTKESHIQTLVNLILLSDLAIVMPQVPELDYMAYIAFELYERSSGASKEFSVRISLSEGAHSMPLDASLDSKHALQVQPRNTLTAHIPLPEFLSILNKYSLDSGLFKRSTTPYEGLLAGMLPVEGDELYKGKPIQPVQVIDLELMRRPYSVNSSENGKDSSDGRSLEDSVLSE